MLQVMLNAFAVDIYIAVGITVGITVGIAIVIVSAVDVVFIIGTLQTEFNSDSFIRGSAKWSKVADALDFDETWHTQFRRQFVISVNLNHTEATEVEYYWDENGANTIFHRFTYPNSGATVDLVPQIWSGPRRLYQNIDYVVVVHATQTTPFLWMRYFVHSQFGLTGANAKDVSTSCLSNVLTKTGVSPQST